MIRVTLATVVAIAASGAPARADALTPPPAPVVPVVEHAVLIADDAALELHGHHLAGAHIRWQHAGKTGDAQCDPEADDLCRVPAESGATWTLDTSGYPSPVAIERTEIAMLVRPDAVIDTFSLGGTVPLRHPDLIASVDCAPAACVLDGDGLLVSNIPAGAASLVVHMRLQPHVVLRRGDVTETSPVIRVPIVRCPLAVVSGAPMRGIDMQNVVVQVGGRCARELARLRFQISGAPVERHDLGDGYVALRIHRTDADELSLAALSDAGDGVIAQVRAATRAAPPVHVALELAHRPIDFIPTNVAATATVTSADWDGTLALAPIEGVYAVEHAAVRGLPSAGGIVALRVVLRRKLPTGDLDIATITEPLQRPLREATSFAPLFGDHPLVELLCDAGNGPRAIIPGATAHIPFDHHDSCRLVLHRERLDPALGAQHLMLELDVTRVDGSPRSEARLVRRLRLAHDDSARTLFLRGAESRFDRYTVRLSQDDDDRTHEDDLPSAQWSVITGRGHARIYATSAIPTGLYRVADRDHSGILTLNFGVLARATWLDSLGREGILCAEAGALTVGLANDTSATGKSLTQIATVAGLGLSVPIANRALAAETSVNLHAWLELEPSRAFGAGSGNAWAFVFGPSITVGNLGADL
jgi:hypothetical protein